jgi:hypothetical protein
MVGKPVSKPNYQAQIAVSLQAVRTLRAHCAQDPAFALHLSRLKRFQAQRLKTSYADLRAQPRYCAAVDFFTEDLYGERDFSGRDEDLQRIVPTVARLFPPDAVATLAAALRLHALAETLDAQMCEHQPEPWSPRSYALAWRSTGQPALRFEQLDLVQQVGTSLDSLVKLPMIGLSLKAMRGPAMLAGLTELHDFLSRGHSAFKALKGAEPFLLEIDKRERELMQQLFDTKPTDARL